MTTIQLDKIMSVIRSANKYKTCHLIISDCCINDILLEDDVPENVLVNVRNVPIGFGRGLLLFEYKGLKVLGLSADIVYWITRNDYQLYSGIVFFLNREPDLQILKLFKNIHAI